MKLCLFPLFISYWFWLFILYTICTASSLQCLGACGEETKCCPLSNKCCLKSYYEKEMLQVRESEKPPSTLISSLFNHKLLIFAAVLLCIPIVFCLLDLLYNCLCTIPSYRSVDSKNNDESLQMAAERKCPSAEV